MLEFSMCHYVSFLQTGFQIASLHIASLRLQSRQLLFIQFIFGGLITVMAKISIIIHILNSTKNQFLAQSSQFQLLTSKESNTI